MIYNETYGNQKGNEALAAVSRAISAQLPPRSYIAACYGGAEFIVVLSETNTGGAIFMGEKIRSAIEALNILHSKNQSGHISVSVVAAMHESEIHDSINAVLNSADSGCIFIGFAYLAWSMFFHRYLCHDFQILPST